MISTEAGSRPISSCASRQAPSTGDSPGSTRPPGKLTSPWWVRRSQVRRVSTTWAGPPAAVRRRAAPARPRGAVRRGAVDELARPTRCGGPSGGGRRARRRPRGGGARAAGRPTGGGHRARALYGRGIFWVAAPAGRDRQGRAGRLLARPRPAGQLAVERLGRRDGGVGPLGPRPPSDIVGRARLRRLGGQRLEQLAQAPRSSGCSSPGPEASPPAPTPSSGRAV